MKQVHLLRTYEQFKQSANFMNWTGLCSNVGSVYFIVVGASFNTFLYQMGLDGAYPIGKGGYMKRTYNEDKMIKAYSIYKDVQNAETLYVGMQDALRHNLYNRYCAWLVENFPESYAYAVQD